MAERLLLGRQMKAARTALAALALACACASQAAAQKEAPGSVSGRVTDGERGIAGVAVVVVSSEPGWRFKAAARGRTDSEGRYHISGVQPGRYTVVPVAPAYVLQDSETFPPGKPLMLSAGDSAEDFDFRLVRGGVITGRVADADGNPLVAEPVNVTAADQQTRGPRPAFAADQRDILTDDRGVYRIYGLPPGRYRVSVGSDTRTLRAPGSKFYRRTFYPSARDESQAKVVELKAGDVAEDVDIMLGEPEKTYRASGRFVAADTGRPVQVTTFGYGMVDPASGRLTGEFTGATTDARGEFQITGLTAGRYRVFTYANSREATEWYSEQTDFEVNESDVSGVTVRLRRGATVSGVVTIEGTRDRAAAARLLSSVQVFGRPDGRGAADGIMPFYMMPSPVAADGTFRLTGVRPGRLMLAAASNTRALMFARVEVNGAELREGLEVAEGAQVSGVHVVMLYGSAVLRGQINFPGGGPPPQGVRMIVVVRRVGATDGRGQSGAEVDSRGRFQVDGLPAGDYEVQARAFGPNVPPLVSESQRVSVAEGGEMTVSLTLAPMTPRGGTP